MVRILVVHGRGAKPPERCKLSYIRRVLLESVCRADPKVGLWLTRHPQVIQLAYYADLSRRISGERLESCASYRGPIQRLYEESRTCPTWVSFRGSMKDFGADVAGLLSRFLSLKTRRQWMSLRFPEVARYFLDPKFASCVRARLERHLLPLLRARAQILLMGHSFGSVVAYDLLWELSHRARYKNVSDQPIHCFVTLGSPLGDETVRQHLSGWSQTPHRRFPTNIRRWCNFAARGDMVCYDAHIGNDFRLMRKLGFLERFEERVNLCNVYRSREGEWNPHKLYGYLILPEVGHLVADFLRDSAKRQDLGVSP